MLPSRCESQSLPSAQRSPTNAAMRALLSLGLAAAHMPAFPGGAQTSWDTAYDIGDLTKKSWGVHPSKGKSKDC